MGAADYGTEVLIGCVVLWLALLGYVLWVEPLFGDDE